MAGAADRGDIGVVVKAFGINDHGEIIGTHTGMFDNHGNPIGSRRILGNLAYWNHPGATATALSVNGEYPWIGGAFHTYPGPYLGSYLSNDGQFIGHNEISISIDEFGDHTATLDGTWLWSLPGAGRSPGKSALPLYEGGVADADLYWGYPNTTPPDGSMTVYSNGTAIPVSGSIRTIRRGPGGMLIATFKGGKDTLVWKDGVWHPSPLLAKAIDISADGTSIGHSHDGKTAPILLNGKWTDIRRYAPAPASPWNGLTVASLDITSGGWVLASREAPAAGQPPEHAALLPIRAECLYAQESQNGMITTEATGVDDFSIGAVFTTPSVGDRIWIMAPQGGSPKSVTFHAPVNGVNPLVLSATDVDFGNVAGKGYLYANPGTCTLHAGSGAQSGADLDVNLHFDTLASASKPLGLKVMKSRTVKVTLYKVTKQTPGKPDNTADQTPDAVVLEKYLNDIFSPQINVRFVVEYAADPSAVDWDQNLLPGDPNTGNHILNCELTIPSYEQNRIIGACAASRPADSNIDIYFVGTDKLIDGKDWASTLRIDENIKSPNQVNACWVLGDALTDPQTGAPRTPGKLFETIVHEVGHVLVGYGHPNDNDGPAPLPGTDHTRRLMVSGSGFKLLRGHLLVKEEWDAAEKWLVPNIDDKEPQ